MTMAAGIFIGGRGTWLQDEGMSSDQYSETERLAADPSGVYAEYIQGPIPYTGLDNYVSFVKYDPFGGVVWGPVQRLNQDSFDVKVVDGHVFTSFGTTLWPIVLDASTGAVIYEYDAGGSGYLAGAAPGPGTSMYVAQRVFGPGEGDSAVVFHRVGAGGIEASSAAMSPGYAGAAVDYYGGRHPNRNRFYVWNTVVGPFPLVDFRFEEWQGYPTVEYIRTVLSSTSAHPSAIAVDADTGRIFAHDFGGLLNKDLVKGYDADGALLWSVHAAGVEDDATQMAAANGLVYVSGFKSHPELPGGLLPALIVLDQATGAVERPLEEWGQDSTDSSDVYGLAVGGQTVYVGGASYGPSFEGIPIPVPAGDPILDDRGWITRFGASVVTGSAGPG